MIPENPGFVESWLERNGWFTSLGRLGVTAWEVLAEAGAAVNKAVDSWVPEQKCGMKAWMEQAMEFAMLALWKKVKRGKGKSVDAEPLTKRMEEDLAFQGPGPDELAADADDLRAVKQWCGTQGTRGDVLRRSLESETLADVAREIGLSVSQVRRILAVAAEVAHGRFRA